MRRQRGAVEFEWKGNIPGFVVVGLGIVLLVIGGRDLSRAIASENWPSVEGEVAYTSMHRDVEHGRSRRVSKARITYMYEVDGESYDNNRAAFGSKSARESSPLYALRRGDTTTVYYAPNKPGLSVLAPGRTTRVYIMPGIGLVMVVLGLGAYLYEFATGQKLEIRAGSARGHGWRRTR